MDPSRLGDSPAFIEARERMVREQIRMRGVTSSDVLGAMTAAPRHLFVPPDRESEAYGDTPLPIGAGQTISQPYIVALMTELAGLTPDSRVLEVGTGCGYQTFILAWLAREVHTIELQPSLYHEARERLARLGFNNIRFRLGNGWGGWPEAAPFDAIVVTAAPLTIPPALKEQLGPAGRLVIPVGPEGNQILRVVQRRGSGFDERDVIPVRFVPMIAPAS